MAEATHLFREGDLALLVDRKGRRYLLRLDPAKEFHTHLGVLPHKALIGQEVGSRLTVGGRRFLALRPTLADYVQEIPRATQVVYPKDMGAILMAADLFPGARVLEGGLGSGALTLALLRAVGERGQVISYEVRQDLVERAVQNIRAFCASDAALVVKVADVYQGIAEEGLDRVILDVPEPWRAVPHTARALVPGGILLCYLPTVLQVHRLVGALVSHPQFDVIESFEVMVRPWYFSQRSARPVHRMVAHTGVLTTARKCAPGQVVPPGEWALGEEEAHTGGEG